MNDQKKGKSKKILQAKLSKHNLKMETNYANSERTQVNLTTPLSRLIKVTINN